MGLILGLGAESDAVNDSEAVRGGEHQAVAGGGQFEIARVGTRRAESVTLATGAFGTSPSNNHQQ